MTAALPARPAKALPKQVALGFSLLTLVARVVMALQYHADGGFQFTEDAHLDQGVRRPLRRSASTGSGC